MGEYNKFSTAEIVIGGLFTLCVDGASALLDLTGIGMIISMPLQASTSVGTTLWLISKGGKRAASLERQLIKHFSNVLPIVPTTFAAFMIETTLHNRPELAKAASVKTSTKSVNKPKPTIKPTPKSTSRPTPKPISSPAPTIPKPIPSPQTVK